MRLSDQLLLVAQSRVGDPRLRSEANLRRASSDLYYSVFHAISEALTHPLGVDPENSAFVETYKALYRQLDHAQAEKKCKRVAQGRMFSPEINRFAKHFITLKNKRERADYDPLEKFSISALRNDCQTTETRLRDFWKNPPEERTSFACYVALRMQRDRPVPE